MQVYANNSESVYLQPYTFRIKDFQLGSYSKLRRFAMPPKYKISLKERLKLDKADEQLAWGLKETADPRDERCAGAPCFGEHAIDQHNCRNRNQHALSLK